MELLNPTTNIVPQSLLNTSSGNTPSGTFLDLLCSERLLLSSNFLLLSLDDQPPASQRAAECEAEVACRWMHMSWACRIVICQNQPSHLPQKISNPKTDFESFFWQKRAMQPCCSGGHASLTASCWPPSTTGVAESSVFNKSYLWSRNKVQGFCAESTWPPGKQQKLWI